MIGFLRGEFAARDPDGCTLDVGGVGYRLHCSSTTLAQLPAEGGGARLWTHLYVREDALTLYGFGTEAERTMFEALISVAGVGPKVALQMCSAFAPDALRRALVTGDVGSLSSVPGIGKKTAGRIILELKEKLALPVLEIVGSDVPGGSMEVRPPIPMPRKKAASPTAVAVSQMRRLPPSSSSSISSSTVLG